MDDAQKFFTPQTGVTFYVAEGEKRGGDYLLWGLVIAPQFKFPSRFQITLGRLQTNDGSDKNPADEMKRLSPAVGEPSSGRFLICVNLCKRRIAGRKHVIDDPMNCYAAALIDFRR